MAASSNCSTTPVNGNNRRPGLNPEAFSLRLEPFIETTLALEDPESVGPGGGAWVPQQLSLDGVRPHTSPNLTLDSQLPKRLIMAARDKESLLEEVINLKVELNEQTRRFWSQRAQVSTVENENRKLEKDIEDLEYDRDTRRVANPDRLRSKLNTLKTQLGDLHVVCEEQRDELYNLRKDFRVTRTRELEVERNVFAEEIVRLLKYMKRLRAWQNRLCCENKELTVIKDRAVLLEIANKRLETCLIAINKNLEKTKQETALFKQKALETTVSNKSDEKRRKELEEEQAKLMTKLDNEALEKEKWLKKIAKLENEIKKLTKDLRETETARAKAELTAKALSSPPPPLSPKKRASQPSTAPVGAAMEKGKNSKKNNNNTSPTARSPRGGEASPKGEAAKAAKEKEEKKKAAETQKKQVAEMQRKQEEAKKKRMEEKRKEEEEKRRQEYKRKKAEEEAKKKQADEEFKKKIAEEEAVRKAKMEAEAKKKADEAKKRREETAKKRAEEEAVKKKALMIGGGGGGSSSGEAARGIAGQEGQQLMQGEAGLADDGAERKPKLTPEEGQMRALMTEEERQKFDEQKLKEEDEKKEVEEVKKREEEKKKQVEEEERTTKERELMRAREEEERKRKEEEMRRKQEEERRKKEEEERKKREAEERKRKEEEAKKKKEAEERAKKLKEEEEKRKKARPIRKLRIEDPEDTLSSDFAQDTRQVIDRKRTVQSGIGVRLMSKRNIRATEGPPPQG